MAAAVATYSHDHFQSLSSIKDAHERFVNVGGQDHVERLKEFFVQWDMDRRFGLAMMHRHFDMERHEKLVEYNGTSTPWPRAYGMKEPQPAMWSFDDKGLLRPTKFYYSETEDGSFTKKDLDFIAKLKAELSLRRLDNVFGLARYPGDNFDGSCEFTQGRANINLQPKDYPADLQAFNTIWFFSEPLWKRGCFCKCDEISSGHPHMGHTTTQNRYYSKMLLVGYRERIAGYSSAEITAGKVQGGPGSFNRSIFFSHGMPAVGLSTGHDYWNDKTAGFS